MFEYLQLRTLEPMPVDEAPVPQKPGQKLPNGAVILDEIVLRTFDHRRDSIVLALAEGVHPFVSWIRTVQTDVSDKDVYRIADYCETGDYYVNDIVRAALAYKARATRKIEMLAS